MCVCGKCSSKTINISFKMSNKEFRNTSHFLSPFDVDIQFYQSLKIIMRYFYCF